MCVCVCIYIYIWCVCVSVCIYIYLYIYIYIYIVIKYIISRDVISRYNAWLVFVHASNVIDMFFCLF